MSQAPSTIQAVLGRRRPAQGVTTRDFARPRRLSEKRLAALRLALENALPALEKRLLEVSGLRLGLGIAALAEADAETLLASAPETPCVLRFRCQKAPAWCFWEPAAAAGVVEAILGAKGAAAAERRLSPTETRIALQFLGEIARALAGVLGLAPGGLALADLALVQAKPELGSWRDGGAEAESHRLEVDLALELGEETSTLRFYLPGIAGDERDARASLPEALPAHLERVEVELSARLAGCEISLDQLLALETGDVIPLEARLDEPATLTIEGLTVAEARLGRHRGRLAVRVEQLRIPHGGAA